MLFMDYKYSYSSVEDTMELAQNIESEKFPNMIICLDGELGSGKTIFVKGFAGALGIEENITSPTFNLIKEYENGEMPLYHMDMYRLEGDASSIGMEDYFHKNGVTIIEWSEMIKDYLPEERLDIEIKVVSEDKRIIILTPHGEKYESLCNAVL